MAAGVKLSGRLRPGREKRVKGGGRASEAGFRRDLVSVFEERDEDEVE